MSGKQGKKYRQVSAALGEKRQLAVEMAIDLLKEHSYTKFDSSLEGKVRIRFKNLQMVRGMMQLPHGTGRSIRVLVLTPEDKQAAAKEAGADIVGGLELVEKIKSENWLDFDACVSSPDMMRNLTKVAATLGRRGLMPKPKAGTVTTDFAPIVRSLKQGQYEYKADKGGVIHLQLGKISFQKRDLEENVRNAWETIVRDKPSEAKGNYISSFFLKSTMSPAVRVAM